MPRGPCSAVALQGLMGRRLNVKALLFVTAAASHGGWHCPEAQLVAADM
jgi:hypothetical protein